jgi:hypothetical protein
MPTDVAHGWCGLVGTIIGAYKRKERIMSQWAYKVVYIDYRGRISCEGQETLIGDQERRSAFARRYMNELGKENWELVSLQPLTSNSAYYIFKRPAQEGDYAEEQPATSAGQPQAQPTSENPASGPTIENA